MELTEALRAGLPVLIPTDTVYGLAALPEQTERLYAVKGRDSRQPTALLAGSVASLLEAIPELDRRILDALLPGPFTLVLANPAGRYPSLTGGRPDAIGVRVPVLIPHVREALEEAGPVVATSANEPGGPDPVSLADVPPRIREAVAVEVDAGPLLGTPSTVIDLTGPEPRVLREGAVPSAEAIAALPT
jgi:tRNA threonylcarbamoyl adenosine modification protein (Sua5/YciO/YrdC/YwlC family)